MEIEVQGGAVVIKALHMGGTLFLKQTNFNKPTSITCPVKCEMKLLIHFQT